MPQAVKPGRWVFPDDLVIIREGAYLGFSLTPKCWNWPNGQGLVGFAFAVAAEPKVARLLSKALVDKRWKISQSRNDSDSARFNLPLDVRSHVPVSPENVAVWGV
jgi:hypothetical protein